MATFYFTYGVDDSENQAYCKGWTEVEADTPSQAIEAYKIFHPVNKNGFLPCCGVAYTKEQMAKEYVFWPGKSMLTEGNGGVFCHDRISVTREVQL